MTSRIIYHDFSTTQPRATTGETGVFLTASVLAKGRRFLRMTENMNQLFHAACIGLCGLTTLLSLGILFWIWRG